MKKDLTLKRILWTLFAFALSAGLIFLLRYRAMHGSELESVMTGREIVLTALADAFCCAGAVFLGLGGLAWISGEGGFLGIGFALSLTASRLFTPLISARKREEYYGKDKRPESFGEYRERKLAKERPAFGHFILIGGIGLLIGLILCLLCA